MRLTRFTDYSLRTLIYLGANDDRAVSTREIARVYGISHHHLVKVVSSLTDLSVVTALRGRNGGLRLARDPADINIGWLVRRTEPDFSLVECFEDEVDTCPITSACALRGLLLEARRAFLATLDRHTLRSLVAEPSPREELLRLWRIGPSGTTGGHLAGPRSG